MEEMGRVLIVLGVVIAIVGGALLFMAKVPGLGRLPGDLTFQRDGFTCFFPIATSIVLSIVLTIVLNVLFGLLRR